MWYCQSQGREIYPANVIQLHVKNMSFPSLAQLTSCMKIEYTKTANCRHSKMLSGEIFFITIPEKNQMQVFSPPLQAVGLPALILEKPADGLVHVLTSVGRLYLDEEYLTPCRR